MSHCASDAYRKQETFFARLQFLFFYHLINRLFAVMLVANGIDAGTAM
jgi:hypothetical protein